MQSLTVKTSIGFLELAGDNTGVFSVTRSKLSKATTSTNAHLLQAAQELMEYFSGRRTKFSLILNPQGSDFDKRVWKVMSQIPYGQTMSYGDIAKRLKIPGGARAVGGACGRNPLLIVIPCHRVLAKDQKLGGFSGGLNNKKTLLQHEGIIFH